MCSNEELQRQQRVERFLTPTTTTTQAEPTRITDEERQMLRQNSRELGLQQTSRQNAFLSNVPALTAISAGIQLQAPPQPQGYKERQRAKKELKRQKEAYKSIKADKLLSRQEMGQMGYIGTKAWMEETLPHSKQTRGDTLRNILQNRDYSNFENLDPVMRSILANRTLTQFNANYQAEITAGNARALCERMMRDSGGAVTPLLDPTLRLGLSLYQKLDHPTEQQQRLMEFYQELDEEMSTIVMEKTLTTTANVQQVTAYFQAKDPATADAAAAAAITANKAQQIQIAKRLLLMQLSDFKKVTKNADDSTTETAWDKSMAVALSHCSRVTLTMPKLEPDVAAGNAQEHRRMWDSIYGRNTGNAAQDNSRAASTHSLERRKVSRGSGVSKEKKVLVNLIGQQGMNCAIGGLGAAGVSGKTLMNDGSCGHFYSMCKEADATHFGAMLMGLESDEAGVTNQMGHTHDAHATAEKASSLGGQRTDEVGMKYGGRQCDLSWRSAQEVHSWLDLLENAMTRWQATDEGMSGAAATEAMRLLSGKKMSAVELRRFSQLCGY